MDDQNQQRSVHDGRGRLTSLLRLVNASVASQEKRLAPARSRAAFPKRFLPTFDWPADHGRRCVPTLKTTPTGRRALSAPSSSCPRHAGAPRSKPRVLSSCPRLIAPTHSPRLANLHALVANGRAQGSTHPDAAEGDQEGKNREAEERSEESRALRSWLMQQVQVSCSARWETCRHACMRRM